MMEPILEFQKLATELKEIGNTTRSVQGTLAYGFCVNRIEKLIDELVEDMKNN